jgi:hypothetical protein
MGFLTLYPVGAMVASIKLPPRGKKGMAGVRYSHPSLKIILFAFVKVIFSGK